MKIFESFRNAANKYGETLAREMLRVGIPDKYILAACRFHCSPPNKSIDILKVRFRQWMTYVVPFVEGFDVNKLTYEQFDELIRKEQQKHICPNPIYDDGNIMIGELKNKKEAARCPLQPICDTNYEFCICSELGYNKYSKQGHRILVIFDKSKALSNDDTKYMFALVKDGEIKLWNAHNLPIGSTKEPFMNSAWEYIDTLPDNAQKTLLTFAKHTKRSNSNIKKNNKTYKNESKNMSKKNTIRLTESDLKRVISESVKRVLKENMGQQYGFDLSKSGSRANAQAIYQLNSILNNSRGKQIECTLNMFYGYGFTCDATFTTNGNSVCTINITSSAQYNKTFEYPTGNAVQQALNIGRNLCNQWLQTIQQKNQQPMQQQ